MGWGWVWALRVAASLVQHIYSLSWFSLLVPFSFFLLCASAPSPMNMCEVCLVYLRVGRTGIREIPSLAQHSHAGSLQNCRLWSLPQTACLSACLPKCRVGCASSRGRGREWGRIPSRLQALQGTRRGAPSHDWADVKSAASNWQAT